ncbi:MAG: acetyl-CoA carboxylase biotin carboxyl carrier protein [Gemmatimonadota bacterium]
MDIKDVNKLVELLRETPEVGSIEVKGWFGTGVVVTRTGTTGVTAGPVYQALPPAAGHAPSAGDGVPATAPGKPAGSGLKEIKSPMVGTFYKAPEPGAEAYAKVGSRISAGQTVCIIEAMKIMNEIEAEISGVIREVLVDDVHPVEFGQVLFRVDPNG